MAFETLSKYPAASDPQGPNRRSIGGEKNNIEGMMRRRHTRGALCRGRASHQVSWTRQTSESPILLLGISDSDQKEKAFRQLGSIFLPSLELWGTREKQTPISRVLRMISGIAKSGSHSARALDAIFFCCRWVKQSQCRDIFESHVC